MSTKNMKANKKCKNLKILIKIFLAGKFYALFKIYTLFHISIRIYLVTLSIYICMNVYAHMQNVRAHTHLPPIKRVKHNHSKLVCGEKGRLLR